MRTGAKTMVPLGPHQGTWDVVFNARLDSAADWWVADEIFRGVNSRGQEPFLLVEVLRLQTEVLTANGRHVHEGTKVQGQRQCKVPRLINDDDVIPHASSDDPLHLNRLSTG